MTSAIRVAPINFLSNRRNPGSPLPSSKRICCRNLFGNSDSKETQNLFDEEQSRSKKKIERYEIVSDGKEIKINAKSNLIAEELRNHEKKSEQCNLTKSADEVTPPSQQIQRILVAGSRSTGCSKSSDTDVSSSSAAGSSNKKQEKQKLVTDWFNKRKLPAFVAVTSSTDDRSAVVTPTTTITTTPPQHVEVLLVPKESAVIVAADSSCCANKDVACDCAKASNTV